MSFLAIGLGLALLAIPALIVRGRLSPVTTARTASAAIVSGFAAFGAGLALTASPLIVWVHEGTTVPGLGHISPGGPWVWTISWVTLLLATARATSLLFRTRRQRSRASIPVWAADTWIDQACDIEIRLVDLPAPMAYAVPGRDPHIVVSNRLKNAVTADEFGAIIAHEAAHLQLNHHRYLLAFHLYNQACGWLPGASRVVARLGLTIEDWADEAAVHSNWTDLVSLCSATRQASTLSIGEGIGVTRAAPVRRTPSSLSHGMTLGGLVSALLLATAATISHSVGDLGEIMAVIH